MHVSKIIYIGLVNHNINQYDIIENIDIGKPTGSRTVVVLSECRSGKSEACVEREMHIN